MRLAVIGRAVRLGRRTARDYAEERHVLEQRPQGCQGTGNDAQPGLSDGPDGDMGNVPQIVLVGLVIGEKVPQSDNGSRACTIAGVISVSFGRISMGLEKKSGAFRGGGEIYTKPNPSTIATGALILKRRWTSHTVSTVSIQSLPKQG